MCLGMGADRLGLFTEIQNDEERSSHKRARCEKMMRLRHSDISNEYTMDLPFRLNADTAARQDAATRYRMVGFTKMFVR